MKPEPTYLERMDDFRQRYAELRTRSYDCVDRIVLNAYHPLGHKPGGFRAWWRRCTTTTTTASTPKTTSMLARTRTGNRGAITGQFVSTAIAARHPNTTITEAKLPGGDAP
jgi:hypothetical protein